MAQTNLQIHKNILACIGNTPLVKLSRLFTTSSIHLYAKLEMFNPGGSIKDRTAYNILNRAFEQKLIDSHTVIIESTSGNMGIGLAQICHYFGLKLILVTDPYINPMAEDILRTYGANLIKVDVKDDLGSYLMTRLAKVQSLLTEIPNSYWPNQYSNIENPRSHEQTYLEIMEAMEGREPDYIFIATSTCGTIRGFADAIKKYNSSTRIVAVDAVGSVIFCDAPQKRTIPGMGASRKSEFISKEQVDRVIHINDKKCVEGCHLLLQSESILAGGSSGAVIKAIESCLNDFPKNAHIVAILADRGERYLQTVYNPTWISENIK